MGRRKSALGRNFLKSAERGLTNSAPCGIILIEVMIMKEFFKGVWKRITCKHDYWWYGEFTYSNSRGELDHERKEVIIRCEHCGKEKTFIYKKHLDK
jgi:RNase P subunit RPR2